MLCHGVLMYAADPDPLLRAVARLTARGGMASLLVRNGDALAMRPGMLGDWMVCGGLRLGHLRKPDRDHRPGRPAADLTARLEGHGLEVTAWYGVRVFTDTAPGDAEPPPDLEVLLACEDRAGRTDPYRRVAALLHLIARRGGWEGRSDEMVDEPWRQPLDETWAGLDPEIAGSPVWSGELKVTGEAERLPSCLPVEDVPSPAPGPRARRRGVARRARRPGAADLRLDRGHVAAAFRSEVWLRVPASRGAGFAPLSRFWRAADGWVRTHGNYPWHRDALLWRWAAGGPVAAAIAGRGAREVEDLVTGAGGVAAAVRTAAGW